MLDELKTMLHTLMYNVCSVNIEECGLDLSVSIATGNKITRYLLSNYVEQINESSLKM